jgi:folate-binding protein YgfZ
VSVSDPTATATAMATELATLTAEVRALRGGAGAFVRPREFVAVRGEDAESYLQGQLSQDVVALSVGQSTDSLLLAPDGKLVALLRVTRLDAQGFLLDTDAGFGETVVARLRKFLLRSKVELEVLPWRCLSLRGAEVDQAAAGLLAVLAEAGVLAVPYSWSGWQGLDLLGGRDIVLDPGADALPSAVLACSRDAVEVCRIDSGIPAMGAELTTKTIAAEAGTALVERTVNFDKGCYTGQELVARLDSRGSNMPRRLVGIVSAGAADDVAAQLLFGMTLHGPEPVEDATADKVVGTVTSAAWSPELGAWVGLGYLHRSVEAPGPVRVRSGDGLGPAHQAEVRTLPLVSTATVV